MLAESHPSNRMCVCVRSISEIAHSLIHALKIKKGKPHPAVHSRDAVKLPKVKKSK